jgi:deoxyribonuclease V
MDLYKIIAGLISQIPKGMVSTSQDLADALGDPTIARSIERIINEELDWNRYPCHRVIGTKFKISPEQIELLKKDGTQFEYFKLANLEEIQFTGFKTSKPLEKLKAQQEQIAKKVEFIDLFGEIRQVGGIDISYKKREAMGAIAIFNYETNELIKLLKAKARIDFPYIPTYLTFRELPIIEKLLVQLDELPTILLLDGNGILHPRLAGLGAHIGVKFKLPAIGCAKSLLCGEVEQMPKKIGENSPIIFGGQLVGHALKTSAEKPIFVSPGNGISFETSLKVVRHLAGNRRLPGPLAEAHRMAKFWRG